MMQPFLKWAGGKRWVAKQVVSRFPSSYGCYIEPFLGSGAIFFELEPEKALLSDSNSLLIDTYRSLNKYPEAVFEHLKQLHHCHSKEFYYIQRGKIFDDPISRAAQFIYLNRTCWNGLYRVNKNDVFNVPIGTKSSVIFPADDFNRVSKALSRADLSACDFEVTINRAKMGDVIYVDPPYTVKHNMNGFVKYNQRIFSWQDQIRLRDSLYRAGRRGCHLFISNADHESVRDLYADFETPLALTRRSIIAGKSGARVATTEMLLVQHG